MTISVRSIVLLLVGAALAVLPIVYGAVQFHEAYEQHEAAVEAFNATRIDATDVQRLRGMAQRINDRQRPEQDMIARLHAAMQQAGLDVTRHFQSLRLEGDSELPGIGLRRQSVAVALGGLQLQQLGSLLLQWRRGQPLWTLSRLELNHARSGNAPLDTVRYDVAITFSAIYASPEGPES